MMRKLILILFPLLTLGLLAYIKYQTTRDITQINNHEQKPLEFKDNTVQCPQCYMYLVGKKHTAQAIDEAHKTHFFDDPGCLILWARDQKKELKTLTLWVFAMDSEKWIDMKKAYYDIKEITPMEYGFAAYESSKEGFITFEEMQLRMLRGETMANPKIKKNLLP